MNIEVMADRIGAVIARGTGGDPSAFESLAREVFEFQYANNAPYRAFCEAAGAAPGTLEGWRGIPAYPTDAFKQEVVASFPFGQAVMAQLTSGTTSPNQRGRIFRDEAGRRMVFAANRVMTSAYLFPDLADGDRMRILILAPSPEMAPSMGMAIGMDQTRRHFGTPDSAFLMRRSGIDVRMLVSAFRHAESSGEPVALIGATSACIYFLQACARKGWRFVLPPGSRLGDGGGYRGRFGEVTREDYYAMVEERLGVPASHCVNILGMAESATNYFDDTLASCAAGAAGERHKVPPPWTRVVAVSPDTGEELPHGETGLLKHWDLANLPTVIAVQTDNLGATDARGGFEILGRAKVVDGEVSEMPSNRAVGPMGDKRVFRLMEAYVNFSIDFKMGRLSSDAERTDVVRARREAEGSEDAQPSCPVVVDDIVAGADDPEARERARRALGTYGNRPGDGTDAPGRPAP